MRDHNYMRLYNMYIFKVNQGKITGNFTTKIEPNRIGIEFEIEIKIEIEIEIVIETEVEVEVEIETEIKFNSIQ